MELLTPRVRLRPWQPEDAESLYQLARDPDVGPPAGWYPHTNGHRTIHYFLEKEDPSLMKSLKKAATLKTWCSSASKRAVCRLQSRSRRTLRRTPV